jgi:general secretion pathway protein N
MLKLLALGIAAFIISLVITVPARVLSGYLPPDIRASGLQGTLWQGQTDRLRFRGFDLGQVSWNVQPLALLVGRLQSDVTIDQADLQGQGTVTIGFNSIRLTDTHLEGNTQLLAAYLSNYGVHIDGHLQADIPALQFNDRGPQVADAVVVWRNARVMSPAELGLGDVNVMLEQDGGTAIANLGNTGDELHLNGGARLKPGWQYQATVRIEPTPSTPEEVRNALPYLGSPDARGTVTLSQQGTLNLGVPTKRLPEPLEETQAD